jgi:hypothetical protein
MVGYAFIATALISAVSVFAAEAPVAKRAEETAAYDPWRHDGYGREWGRDGYGRHDGYGRGRGWVVNTKRDEASAAYDPWRHDGYGRGGYGGYGRHDGYGRGRGWTVDTSGNISA